MSIGVEGSAGGGVSVLQQLQLLGKGPLCKTSLVQGSGQLAEWWREDLGRHPAVGLEGLAA